LGWSTRKVQHISQANTMRFCASLFPMRATWSTVDRCPDLHTIANSWHFQPLLLSWNTTRYAFKNPSSISHHGSPSRMPTR
jgi:hypothetical protein